MSLLLLLVAPLKTSPGVLYDNNLDGIGVDMIVVLVLDGSDFEILLLLLLKVEELAGRGGSVSFDSVRVVAEDDDGGLCMLVEAEAAVALFAILLLVVAAFAVPLMTPLPPPFVVTRSDLLFETSCLR